ncbi:ribonuclease Z [Candidatus Micrarchaeota archaeon]|nr:ribonuclease Z [Candidatus Micrarchaeota archaeon]
MSNLQITFLGTSGGVPTPKRGMPSIAIKWNGEIYLFDCGEGTQRAMMQSKVGYGSINSIFISHLHLDHFLGVFGLIETLHLLQPSPKPISIYAPEYFELINKYKFITLDKIKPRGGLLLQGNDFSISAFTVKHTKNSYGFIFKENDRRKFDEEKAHALGLQGRMFSEIQKKGSLVINGKKILLDDVSWIKPGRKIVYSGDCAPSENLIKVAKDADLLIHESTFANDKEDEAKERMHTTSKQAAMIAKQSNVKKLVLTHISPRYSEEESIKNLLGDAKSVFNNTIVANDGLIVEV